MRNVYMTVGTAGTEYNNEVYFSGNTINGLFKVDLESGEEKFIASFEKEKNKDALHCKCFLYKNEAWFIPWMGEYLTCVNLDTYEMDYYNISISDKLKTDDNKDILYLAKQCNDESFFLVSKEDNSIFKVDMKKKMVSLFMSSEEIGKQEINNIVVIYEELWLVVGERNKLLKINNKNCLVECVTEIPKGKNSDLLFAANRIWFVSKEEYKMIGIDIVNNSMLEIPINIKELKNFNELLYFDEKIWVLPFGGEYIFAYDLCEKKICKIMQKEMISNNGINVVSIFSKKQFLLSTAETGYLCVYDIEKKTFKCKKIWYAEQKWEEMVSKLYDLDIKDIPNIKYKNEIYAEHLVGINNFIKMIKNDENKKDTNIS